jgi:hypothetical protein
MVKRFACLCRFEALGTVPSAKRAVDCPYSSCATYRGQSTALRLGQSPSVGSTPTRTPSLDREREWRIVADALRLDLHQSAAFFADCGQSLARAFAHIADRHRIGGRLNNLMCAAGRAVLNLREHPRIADAQLAWRSACATAAHCAQLPQPALQRLQQFGAIGSSNALHRQASAQRQKSSQNQFDITRNHDAVVPSFTCLYRRDPNYVPAY